MLDFGFVYIRRKSKSLDSVLSNFLRGLLIFFYFVIFSVSGVGVIGCDYVMCVILS